MLLESSSLHSDLCFDADVDGMRDAMRDAKAATTPHRLFFVRTHRGGGLSLIQHLNKV
jgi:hypothetical protein